MNPVIVWLVTMIGIAIFLYVAEVFIPSHGVLSILATGCIAVGVVLCFLVSRWLGAGVLLALLVLGPFGMTLGISVWQRTPIGRRMVLTQTSQLPEKPFVLVGSAGTAVTELRPMGECEFGDTRLEARSELGRIVRAGQAVVVIAISNGVATVRPVDTSTDSA